MGDAQEFLQKIADYRTTDEVLLGATDDDNAGELYEEAVHTGTEALDDLIIEARKLIQEEDENQMNDEDQQELLDVLGWVISQACGNRHTGEDLLDSMALSAYADGLRVLAKHGRVRITHEVGRRVIAEWAAPE